MKGRHTLSVTSIAATAFVLSIGIIAPGRSGTEFDDVLMTTESSDSFYNADQIRRNSDGVVSLLRGGNLSERIEYEARYQTLVQQQSYGEMATFFVQHHGRAFQLVDPSKEVIVTAAQKDELGYHQVRLSQAYQNIPVLDTEMIVHFNPEDHVYLVQSQFIPTPSDFVVTPALTEDEIVRLLASASGPNVTIGAAALAILPGRGQHPTLVYKLEMRRSMIDARNVVVDANSGSILREVPTIYNSR